MILEQAVFIDAPPTRVFAFFEAMQDNYTRWHPDHISFRWLQDGRLAEGNRFYFEERIHGQHLKRIVRFTKIVPDRHVEFTPENRFVRLFLPSICFSMQPEGSGCRLVQRLRVRVGPIGYRLNRRGFAAVEKHMREEGQNMKALLEG